MRSPSCLPPTMNNKHIGMLHKNLTTTTVKNKYTQSKFKERKSCQNSKESPRPQEPTEAKREKGPAGGKAGVLGFGLGLLGDPDFAPDIKPKCFDKLRAL